MDSPHSCNFAEFMGHNRPDIAARISFLNCEGPAPLVEDGGSDFSFVEEGRTDDQAECQERVFFEDFVCFEYEKVLVQRIDHPTCAKDPEAADEPRCPGELSKAEPSLVVFPDIFIFYSRLRTYFEKFKLLVGTPASWLPSFPFSVVLGDP